MFKKGVFMNLLFSFKGKIGRGMFALLFITSQLIYGLTDLHFPDGTIVHMVLKIAILIMVLVCFLSATIRRLHDIGYYGLDLLFFLIPGYNLYILLLLFSYRDS